MPDEQGHKPDTLELIGQEGRLARTSRMIAENEPINAARKVHIRDRANEYLSKHGISQTDLARQINASKGTVSEVLRGTYGQKKRRGGCDDTTYLRRINNWMELDARRQNLIQNREYVEHSVAREIVAVAEIVAETCKMGIVFGPAQIGKSFTLANLDDADRLGNPVLFRVGEAHVRPLPLCRMMCERLKLPASYTFDKLFRRLVGHLKDTKRMLMIDEADRCSYRALEFIRDLHDETGCPVLLAGKPAIYEKFGFRQTGGYREIVDQLSSRVVIRRDLTERTRKNKGGKGPDQPLFTKDDIRKLIQVASLGVQVSEGAVTWLQRRACVLSLGGFGMTKILLFLAYKYAVGSGATTITVEILESVEELCVGGESVERIEDVVADPKAQCIPKIA